MFGGYPQPQTLPWRWAEERLTRAANYWVASTRPDGRPHCRPVWGVWLDGMFYFDTGSLINANLQANPEITVHLESANEAVIVEGRAELLRDLDRWRPFAEAYNRKYNWDFHPARIFGGFWMVSPRVVFGWLSDPTGLDRGAAFNGTATRWTFSAG
jgi:hypothetical protein